MGGEEISCIGGEMVFGDVLSEKRVSTEEKLFSRLQGNQASLASRSTVGS